MQYVATLKLQDIMTPTVLHVGPECPLSTVASMMVARHVSCLLVLHEQRPVGIVTERDVIGRARAGWADLTVRDNITFGMETRRVPKAAQSAALEEFSSLLQIDRLLDRYRIEEVKAALADPAQAPVPVLTLAMDAGFQSLGPFNRAFKAETGLTPTEFRRAASAAGLTVEDELAFGKDYAETLRRWRVEFLARDNQVRQLGFDTRFMRIWEFYLAYCEAAFASGNTDVMQFTLRRPG